MTPEELIGPAAAKALAEHYDLTPKAKPLPDVVTMEETAEFVRDWHRRPSVENPNILADFVLRWLRARMEALPPTSRDPNDPCRDTNPGCLLRAETFKALTGREWAP